MNFVLFVDDDPEITSSTRRLLHTLHFDWQVTFVNSVFEARECLKEKRYDLVISDIRMPGESGIDLLEHVRQNYPQALRIAFSGHSDRETSLKASGLAHQYLAKPSPIETIVAVIQQALNTGSLIKDEKLRNLIAQLKTIPSQPEAYLQIVAELKNAEPSIGKVGKIISQDVSMSAKILQLVNSAFFGLPQKVMDPTQAAVLLGVDTIRDLVLTVGVFSQFDPRKLQRLSLTNLWNHSQRIGRVAKAIAIDLKADKKLINDAFVAGLLHDVGKLILADNYPDNYYQVMARSVQEKKEAHLLEQQIFGSTHAQVGAYLFGLWGLSGAIVSSVAGHHQPILIHEKESSVLLSVHIANVLDYQVNPEHINTGRPPELDEPFLSRSGVELRLDRWQNLASKV